MQGQLALFNKYSTIKQRKWKCVFSAASQQLLSQPSSVSSMNRAKPECFHFDLYYTPLQFRNCISMLL